MNVYEEAHALAKAVKESEEFKQFDYFKKIIDDNEELSKAVKDFQSKQMEMQAKQLMGEESDANVMGQVQELYQILSNDPTAAQYLQAQMRFSLMMKDVYEIIGDAIGVGNLF